MKLYEIDQAILNCIDLETGEIIDTEQLDKLTMEREAKLENIACWIICCKCKWQYISNNISNRAIVDCYWILCKVT